MARGSGQLGLLGMSHLALVFVTQQNKAPIKGFIFWTRELEREFKCLDAGVQAKK